MCLLLEEQARGPDSFQVFIYTVIQDHVVHQAGRLLHLHDRANNLSLTLTNYLAEFDMSLPRTAVPTSCGDGGELRGVE